MVQRRSHLALQNLPSATDYGWEAQDTSLVPIMTDNLPAPLALIELSGCKSKCTSNRCKCFKNNLICTDMCKCEPCENKEEHHDDNEEGTDFEIDDSSDDE